jgi:hypothetical protein
MFPVSNIGSAVLVNFAAMGYPMCVKVWQLIPRIAPKFSAKHAAWIGQDSGAFVETEGVSV